MYSDPTGHFVISISTFLLSMVISASIGAAVAFATTAYKDYADDGEIFNKSISLETYIGNTLGGFIAGAGIGACTVLGAGLGTAMAAGEALMLGSLTLSGAAAVGIGTSTAFVTGGLSYTVKALIDTEQSFSASDMLIEAASNSVSGMLSFVGGMAGGVTGVYVPRARNSITNTLKYHGGLTYFGVYPIKYFLSQISNRIKEIIP